MRPKGLAELIQRYGKPWASTEDRERFERRHMRLWSSSLWEGDNVPFLWPEDAPFRRIYCNSDLMPILDDTFRMLLFAGKFREIKTFDGCWNVRTKRGNPSQPSIHSFGLAIDFNASLMPLGMEKNLWSDEFMQIMEDCGWVSGASFPVKDFMHFQYAEGY